MKKENPIEILNEILLRINYDLGKTLTENEVLVEQVSDYYYDQFGNLKLEPVNTTKMPASQLYPEIKNGQYPKTVTDYTKKSAINTWYSTASLRKSIQNFKPQTYKDFTPRPQIPQSDVLGPQGSYIKSLGIDKQSLEMKSKIQPMKYISPEEYTKTLGPEKYDEFVAERKRINTLDKDTKFEEYNKKLSQAFQEFENYDKKYDSYYTASDRYHRNYLYYLALYYPEKWTPEGEVVDSGLDDLQDFLDWVGVVPLIGDAVDIGNAAIYLTRALSEYIGGDKDKGNDLLVEFCLSVVAVIPIIGTPIKLGLKNVPWSSFLKGASELFESIENIFKNLSKEVIDGAVKFLNNIKKIFDDVINWISNSIPKFTSKIVELLNNVKTMLKNLSDAITENLSKASKLPGKLGGQTIKWTGKIIDSPAGGAWLKTMRNLSKEMCGPERQQSEWAKQRIPEDVVLIGGLYYGNIACDVLSAMAWTSGPLGPLMSASIEIQNARNYYEQGEKLMGDIQLVLGFLPFIGTVGKGVIQAVGKNSVDVLTSPSFLYKIASWIEGEGVIKLTSDEVKAIMSMGKTGLKSDATKGLKNLATKVDWVYKNAAELGLGPNIVVGMRMAMPKLLSSTERVFDFFIRLAFYLSIAHSVHVSEEKEIRLEEREKAFDAFDKTYRKKDSFNDTSTGTKKEEERLIPMKDISPNRKKLFKGNYGDTTI